MKKVFGFLIALMFVMPVASQAVEFEIAGEQIAGNPETSVSGTPAEVHLSGSLTLNQPVRKIGTSLTAKRVEALVGKTDALQKETAGLRTEIGTGLSNLKTSLDENTTSTNEAGKNISGLTTAVENTAKATTGMNSQLSQNFWLMLAGFILLIILAVVILLKTRAAHSVNEEKVDELLNVVHAGFQTARVDQLATQNEVVATRADVAKIPDALVKLKRLATVLEFKDVDGKGLNVTVTPLIKDGTVFTLRLPDSVDLTAAYTDSTIPRTPAKNRTHLVSTDEEIIKAYYAGAFNGHDDASSLKLRIIKAAFRDGEIAENK
jgi:hypothetical protein